MEIVGLKPMRRMAICVGICNAPLFLRTRVKGTIRLNWIVSFIFIRPSKSKWSERDIWKRRRIV
jgi:hypothetical protein